MRIMTDPLRDLASAYRLDNWLAPPRSGDLDLYRGNCQAIAAGWPAIQSPAVATAHPRGCLLLFREDRWASIAQEIARLPNDQNLARTLQRLLLGYATHLEQSEEWVSLDSSLIEFGQIDNEAILISFPDGHAELWSERSLINWMEDPDHWARALA